MTNSFVLTRRSMIAGVAGSLLASSVNAAEHLPVGSPGMEVDEAAPETIGHARTFACYRGVTEI
jgi:hypothetical protein